MQARHIPTPAHFHDFAPFKLACKARQLTEQLDALKAQTLGKAPSFQDIDATAPDYVDGLSKAVR